jgi:hypothetical protein
MEEITIYKFQLEAIQEALRVVSLNYNCASNKTCMDRMVTQANQFAKNAIEGNKDKEVRYGI